MSPLETRRIHIGAWQTSGMSQAAYCREHGLNTKTFGNWVRKHRAGQVIRPPALVPGHDQANAYAGEYDASSRSGRSCVGTAVDGFAALAGGVVEVSLIANPGKIWLMVEPVDMRRGIDGLSVLVEQALQRSPCAGSAFVFCNRAGNRIKVLLWDGTGAWLCQRRLHQGRFVWERSDTGGMELTSSQWEWLIAGVDWRRLGLQSCARKYS